MTKNIFSAIPHADFCGFNIIYMTIFKHFSFDSAHHLPHVPEGHKCKNIHGHTYHLTVYVEGTIGDKGWVMDFTDLKNIVKPFVDLVDHQLLNNIPGLENPTAENIVIWFWDNLKPLLTTLTKLELKETPTSGVIYQG